MPTYGKKLLDNNGNTILPKTRSNLVYHGSTLLSTYLDNIVNGSVTVGKATALTTNAGDSNTPVYFSNGKPVSTGKSFANYVAKDSTSTISVPSMATAILHLVTTGQEASIEYKNSSSKGWTAGAGCGGAGNKFSIWSTDSGKNVFQISTGGVINAGPSISGQDDNATRIRNISPRNADWSAFSTNYLMTCKE